MVARIGTAGWSIPKAAAAAFSEEGTHLARYAQRLNAAEINTSFYRPHKPETYARWAASVPDDFRFSVKLPKAITHVHRLVDCEDLLMRFADEIGGLGHKRGPILIQLPPSFAWPGAVAQAFFDLFQRALPGPVAIEPRHRSWYTPEINAELAARGIARVAADPPVPEAARAPGGWGGLRYFRLHGSPRVYWSSYDAPAIAEQAARIVADAEIWTIYDNTASGAALPNALELLESL